MPVHTIVKSCGLPMTLIVGYFGFGYRPGLTKLVSVIIITIGTIMFSLSDKQKAMQQCTSCVAGVPPILHNWDIGIAKILLGLIFSAFAGNVQQRALAQHGPDPLEPVFMTNLMSLPISLFALTMAKDSAIRWAQASPLKVSPWALVVLFFNPHMPLLLLYCMAPATFVVALSYDRIQVPAVLALIAAIISQTMCIIQVYDVATHSTALTTTTINTVRKFLSMVISTLFFQHFFDSYQWAGIAMVCAAALAYSFSQSRGSGKLSER